MADDCIFCNPAPDALVHDGPDGIIVVDDPIRDGHVMVGIRSHAQSLHDAPPDEAASMMRLAAKASSAIVKATGVEKTYVAAVGDQDKHFHVHLLPKGADDPNLGPHIFSGSGWAAFLPPAPDSAKVASVNDAIRSALR